MPDRRGHAQDPLQWLKIPLCRNRRSFHVEAGIVLFHYIDALSVYYQHLNRGDENKQDVFLQPLILFALDIRRTIVMMRQNLRQASPKTGAPQFRDGKSKTVCFPAVHFRTGGSAGQIAGTLSGGEQQMLAMGRALISDPKLLILDEPSMGLAPILVEQVFDIIRALHKAGTTILLVEQNAEMALSVADRAYVMETGLITLSGTGKELAASEAVRKAYLGG